MRPQDRHGGDVYDAARRLNCRPADVLDFSASINPLGPAPGVPSAIRRALSRIEYYPDPGSTDLRSSLAGHHGVPRDSLLLGNGAMEFIDVLPRVLQGGRVAIFGPTFNEYAKAFQRAGWHVTMLLASRADGYAPPVAAGFKLLAARRSPIDALVLCNPNSPTGRAIPAEVLHKLVDRATTHGVWCLVDESFADYAEQCRVLEKAPNSPRLVVLRSFTKLYALPGLRLGYLVARPATVGVISEHVPPWSVNVLAQAAGSAALSDRRHVRASLAFMDRERTRFSKRLASLPGLTVIPSEANFLLLELPPGSSAENVTRCLFADGILVRDCSAIPGCSRRTIRVAIRRVPDNNRLLRVMRPILSAERGRHRASGRH